MSFGRGISNLESFEVTLWDSVELTAVCRVTGSHLVRKPQKVGPLDVDPPETCEIDLVRVMLVNPEDHMVEVDIFPALCAEDRGEILEQILESIESWD